MTSTQKETIILLRSNGNSYGEITVQMGLARDAVISFCRRHFPRQDRIIHDGDQERCKQCGAELVQQNNMKRRVFCCDECRVRWWSEHPEMIKRKAIYTFVCENCGKEFSAYGNSGRKYCCHECYIEHRFGCSGEPSI